MSIWGLPNCRAGCCSGRKSIAPGSSGLVQVVLDRRIGVLKGDGFILRDQSAQRTIAGDVVDPFPPARGRAKPDRLPS